ncbi:MAG: LytTR family transcriptional regulator [Candidatus Izimaplasma sp.]|nr:LytTR family transcriptional regulator [Candidatus Izimaplasma bacterium]
MKILYKGSKEELQKLEQQLRKGEFEFVLSGEDFELRKSSFLLDTVIGEKVGNYIPIHHSNILYIESYGHDIVCHTIDEEYTIREKLYEIEELFESYGFIRVHKSFIVNRHHIISIEPIINRKFKLKLSSGDIIEVSRKYYSEFKRFIGMRG